MSMAVSGSVHSAISRSPALSAGQRLARAQRRQGAFEPAQIEGLFGHCVAIRSFRLCRGVTLYTWPVMADGTEIPQRIARLTPLADVLARVDALVKPVAPREVETGAAVGPRPRRRRERGPAIRACRSRCATAGRCSADLTTDASSYAPAPLPAAARIDVGEPMPAGADAVAPLDVVVARGGRMEIIAPVAAGEGVLPAGADADAERRSAREGRRLTRIQAAALAAAGVTRLQIREPRVRLVRARAAGDAVIDAAVAPARRRDRGGGRSRLARRCGA